MKTFLTLALTLVLTAACLVGCGCTNQNMEETSAPTVLPTNEEIWNSTETTTHTTTESTVMPNTTGETTEGNATEESASTSRSINETEVQNHVNAHTDMMDKIRDNEKASTATEGDTGNSTSRMMPGTR